MGFECLHCGTCCEDSLVQINLTFKDILRLKKKLKVSVKELFEKKIIGFNPFLDPETEEYDIELGLNKPCILRENGKCSVYDARPLNCKLFPYWLIAKFGSDVKQMFEPEYKGIQVMQLTPEEQQAYLEFVKPIGDQLIEESEATDKAVAKIKQELNWEPGGIDAGGILEDHELEKKRLEAMKELISKLPLNELIEKIIKEIT